MSRNDNNYQNRPVWTGRELAHYLDMEYATVLKLAREGVIPGVKIGKSWRFFKSKLDEYFLAEGDR